MLHVLVGENSFKPMFDDCVRRGRSISWIVPKAARRGDSALLLFHHDEFVGTGVVDDEPVSDSDGNQSAYRALVRDLRAFKKPLLVEDVAKRIPEWKWPASYSRGRTTPAVEIARKLNRIVGEHATRVGLELSPATAGAMAKHSTTKRDQKKLVGSEPKDMKLSAAQLDAVIHEQTGGARLGPEGRKFLRAHVVTERKASNRKYILELRSQQGTLACETCGVDLAQRYGPEFRATVELHHRIPLRKGLQTPKGTDAFSLLCPSCHRVVHYKREDPLEVDALRRMLQGVQR
jgi:hypothetical protein